VQISISIILDDDEAFAHTPEEAGNIVIDALDGVTPENDSCSVTITRQQRGHVGTPPPPPPLPEPGDPDYIEPPPLPTEIPPPTSEVTSE